MVFVGSSECDINIEVGSYSVNERKFMILILFWVVLIQNALWEFQLQLNPFTVR